MVDASVAVKWIFAEENSARALALLDAAATSGAMLVGPPILRGEVLNAVYQRARGRAGRDPLDFDLAEKALSNFLRVAPRIIEPPGLYERALEIAHASSMRATCDPVYVALAEAIGATMWTADAALLRSLGGAFPFVVSVADYPL